MGNIQRQYCNISQSCSKQKFKVVILFLSISVFYVDFSVIFNEVLLQSYLCCPAFLPDDIRDSFSAALPQSFPDPYDLLTRLCCIFQCASQFTV